MQAIQFNGKIKKGKITFPKEHRLAENQDVKVIVWVEEHKPKEQLQAMMKTLEALQQVNPFSKITDPVAWQKQIRSEW